jgi:ABC-type phosphate transport system substrate-binding protein
MTHTLKCFLSAAGLALSSVSAWAGDVFVIANANVTLTQAEVKDVFVGEKQIAGGTKLVPMDNAAAQADFLAKVMSVDAAKYASIWSKRAFREGINPPPVRGSDAEVLAAVKSTPGAVGYVSKAPDGVKVIAKF